jgi:hypothetical protein
MPTMLTSSRVVRCARLLRSVVRIDVERQWRDEGARDTRHLLQMRYGISLWEASRWLRAAHALEQLPAIARAFERGRLGLDKVLELCRSADASTDADLARWSASVSFGAVRRRADAEVRRTREEVVEIERARFLRTWYSDEGRRWGIEGELPAVDGAIVERAIELLAASIPAMPDEDDVAFADARRADALVALASARIADDPDPDRATIVIHAPDDAISGASVEGGPPVPRDTVERLLCTSRSQTVVEDPRADVIAMTRTARLAPAWLLRQVRYRDAGCTFAGCGARRFTEAHHVTFWRTAAARRSTT